jgi:hypothetical protein
MTLVTVTAHVALKLPSTVVTLIFAVPAKTPDTLPVELTVATAGVSLDHVTFWFVAFAGAIVSES